MGPLIDPNADPRADATGTVAPGLADRPTVSVVIPVFNDAKRLDRCLRTLASQSYPADRIERIVVDNGSSDDSCAVAERWKTRVLRHPELRVGAMRNRGVEESKGEVLVFLDSDHEVPPDWLANGVAILRENPELAMVGFPYLAPADGTWVQRAWELHRLRHADDPETDWLASGNMFVRREWFDSVDGFREELVATEDVDLCTRLRQRGARIRKDRRVGNVHHGEPDTLRRFFRKEVWHGTSGMLAFLKHGAPLRELPSILYPLYHLFALLAVLIGAAIGVATGRYEFAVGAGALLLAPSLALAVRTARQCRRLGSIPALSVLYLTYGLARVVSLFRG